MKTPDGSGDLFSVKEFHSMLKSGELIDDDGFGNYGSETERSNQIVPMDPAWFLFSKQKHTHVWWYNR